VSLYLLPIALGALVLPRGMVALLGALAALAYTALLFRHVPLPHVHGVPDFDLHVTGMWVNFLVSAVLLVGFLVHFISLVERERARVARAREGALRDEALLGLGFLAAGTAHELNTPLGTMRLLLNEWRAEPGKPVSARDLELMNAQIERLSAHVRSLASTAKRASLEHGEAAEPAADWLQATVREWHALRPSVEVDLAVSALGVDRALSVDPTLPQAIVNLLNNAADASAANGAATIRVEAGAEGECFNVRILDRGPGLTNASRGEGLGIGLLISNATIERFGGHVRRFARSGGGSITEVNLPFLGVRA
jgi:two-component system sensor histidine kinase RegB